MDLTKVVIGGLVGVVAVAIGVFVKKQRKS